MAESEISTGSTAPTAVPPALGKRRPMADVTPENRGLFTTGKDVRNARHSARHN